jgi:hypothetical protein
VLAPGVPEVFVPSIGGDGDLVYRPALLGRARLHYVSSPANLDGWRDHALLAVVGEEIDASVWESASAVDPAVVEVEKAPVAAAAFANLPSAASNAKSYATWSKALATFLYQSRPGELRKCARLKQYSALGEEEGAFRVRLREKLREERDEALEMLRTKYATKTASLEEKIRVAEQRVDREESQANQQKFQTAISVGTAVLGALFGGRKSSSVGRASTAMRGVGRISREKEDVRRAEETLEANRAKLEALQAELAEATEKLQSDHDPEALEFETVTVRPRKADTQVESVQLAWTPWRVTAGGMVADFDLGGVES